ncbi:helix-turn-helix domain-containing protein [Streptomyces lasiicapitis]|uniref:helix-turn-helix domain-containing protein n=1 Tax=Streptomyces lasiicapitis TaxID=1923961 RepID=UPI00331CC7B0
MRAAASSGAGLIAEAAVLADGWAALVDPEFGPVYSHPHAAGPDGVRAAAHPPAHPHLTIRQADDAVFVLGPDTETSAARVALIGQITVDLLHVRAQQADEIRGAEQRLHTAVLHLLRRGHHRLAADVLGGCTATHATVYRLTGRALHTAHQALWRAARPDVSLGDIRTLICLAGTELVVVALHGADGDPGPTGSLIARIAERHRLTGGAASPAALDMFATAWTEAGTARHSTAIGCLTSPTGLRTHGLIHAVPTHRLTAWSAAILQPLDRKQSRTLEAWLRTGSAHAAAGALGVSEGTVRARLRDISNRLAAELDHPTVQAQLLLALRVPASADPVTAAARLPDSPLPTELLSPDKAERWASALLAPLDARLRIALRCWLKHRGRTAPAAAELGLHRTTLTTVLRQCGQALGLDLSSATVRAELHLAVETIATPGDVPAALPRRGGRTYGGPQQ